MEFLFLNEEVSQDENSFEQTKAFAESVGVDVGDITNKSLEEVMLEAAEDLHEAEVQAMQEEFSLFQESVGKDEEEFFQEAGILKTIGDTLKKWWKAIKDFCVKMWAKIVHWFWVAVNWCRKTIQSAVNKVHGSNFVYVPKKLADAHQGGVTKVKEITSNITAMGGLLAGAAVGREIVKEAKLGKEAVKKANGVVKEFRDFIANAKKEIVRNKNTTTGENGKKKSVSAGDEKLPIATWKKWMDEALKEYENTKKAAETANKNAQNAIKKNDKALEDWYKNPDKKGGEEGRAVIKATGSLLSLTARAIAHQAAAATSFTRWVMGYLFSSASYKASKEEKEIKF